MCIRIRLYILWYTTCTHTHTYIYIYKYILFMCNQYYCNLSLFIALFVKEHHYKTSLGHVGTWTCVAGFSQQTWCALDHHTSPNKDASSSELSNTMIPICPNVNSHIVTDAFLCMMIECLLNESFFPTKFHDK